MEKDLFEKILKELLNGKSLRELQEKYHFDRKRFKERINREYPVGTPQREQIEKQLRKLEDVIEIFTLPRDSSVYRELVLVKVESDVSTRADIVSIVDIFRAKIVDVSPDSMVIEITGDHSKVNGLLTMLDGFNIVEIVRTGLAGISRGLNDLNIKK